MSYIRSMTGHHDLLPANNKATTTAIPHVPVHDLSAWTFGSGTVIWRIWPAVLVHTAVAALIVVITKKTTIDLGIPSVLLTLLGVVIGFVISLRVSSAYDRYWWGRCAWSDIIKTSRTMSRLIWIHTPTRISNTPGTNESSEEVGRAMREKKIALELIEAFAIALKHHLRGELGIYYEDLYPVVRPLHEHHNGKVAHTTQNPTAPEANPTAQPPSRLDSVESSNLATPAVDDYGTLGPKRKRSFASIVSSSLSDFMDGEREPLLPPALPGHRRGASVDLIPFTAVVSNIFYYANVGRWIRTWRANERANIVGDDEPHSGESQHQEEGHTTAANFSQQNGIMRHRRTNRQTHSGPGKHRPLVAGDGDNIPLEILRCLSEWLSVLETRGSVSGSVLGGMYNCISSLEDSLTTTERILTTPLPFVYAVHIRHTVWLYLLSLPFQLTRSFSWYAIPGTTVAAFFYLGFIAAGEEIEQPFGYDDDDLDLDLFCRGLIKADIHSLVSTPFPNAPVGSHVNDGEIYQSSTVVELSQRKPHSN